MEKRRGPNESNDCSLRVGYMAQYTEIDANTQRFELEREFVEFLANPKYLECIFFGWFCFFPPETE